MKKKYVSPELSDLGSLSRVTAGNMGSFNDGGGAGDGMAETDGMGMGGEG